MYGKVALFKIQTKKRKRIYRAACAAVDRIKSKSIQNTSITRWLRYIKWRIQCWIASNPFNF